MTGDGDMAEAVESVIDEKGIWKVEVVGLEHSMSNHLKDLAKKFPEIVTIRYLNAEDYCFFEYERKREHDKVKKEEEKQRKTN